MPFQGRLDDGISINYDNLHRTDYLVKVVIDNKLPRDTLEEILISLSKLRKLIPKDEFKKRFKSELNYYSAVESTLWVLYLRIDRTYKEEDNDIELTDEDSEIQRQHNRDHHYQYNDEHLMEDNEDKKRCDKTCLNCANNEDSVCVLTNLCIMRPELGCSEWKE